MTGDYYDRVNPDLLQWVPPDARTVLEFGCGSGALGAAWKESHPGRLWFGVEIDPEAAEVARSRLNFVSHRGDAEVVTRDECAVPPQGVDCLVYGDVLEHLTDPWVALARHCEWLRPGGTVLACVPNVQHWSNFVRLLKGAWEYEAEGILDRGHLRFFDLGGVERMFGGAGLTITGVGGRPLSTGEAEHAQFMKLTAGWLMELGLDAGEFSRRTTIYQYVVKAVK